MPNVSSKYDVIVVGGGHAGAEAAAAAATSSGTALSGTASFTGTSNDPCAGCGFSVSLTGRNLRLFVR